MSENSEMRAERLRDVRSRFRGNPSIMSAGAEYRRQAISMFREWCVLTGEFRGRDAAERFIKFIEGEADVT